jgi:molybdopterin/thiamine biosynthesis adenylyltransferase
MRLQQQLLQLTNPTIKSNAWKPALFDMKISEDVQALAFTLENNPGIEIHDEIRNQLGELIKSQQPKIKFTTPQLQDAINQHLGDTPAHLYGTWVFYPWTNRLVHVLSKDEFIEARTSRNNYKITPEEREILSNKKIGVIGLSVGQSVSLAIAMERICGEIRLTDFDILELSNLNRIRTGLHTIGLKKAIAVAREIAEIDPYLTVSVFEEGLHESNMDDFFCKGGKLDLIIEESDGLDIKILSRIKAKSLGIPVLMEASDKCMVDVERFDLEPHRPLLHGLIEHLNPEQLKLLKTNEQKIPYMLDILGIETCSDRLKASMLEIEQSITTWPQLASAVIMGGGVTADVARRLLLNQFTDSGRYYVDVESIIANKIDNNTIVKTPVQPSQTDVAACIEFIKSQTVDNSSTEYDLPEQEEVQLLIEAASLAPSGGNSQPWKWMLHHKTLYLINPITSEHSILGYDNKALYLAHGAAIENLRVKAASMYIEIIVNFQPFLIHHKNIIASINFKRINTPNKLAGLSSAIGLRMTNRKNEKGLPIHSETLNEIKKYAGDYNSSLDFVTDDSSLQSIAKVLGEIERIRLLDPMGHKDFVEEIRWSDKEALQKKDGIELDSIDLSISERAGFFVSKEPSVINLINQWDKGGAFSKLTTKTVESALAIGILRMPDWSAESFFYGGQILERIWLIANQLGLSFQPTAASVFIRHRWLDGEGIGLDPKTIARLTQLAPMYDAALNLDDTRKEVFIFRLNRAVAETKRSIRKPLEDIWIK